MRPFWAHSKNNQNRNAGGLPFLQIDVLALRVLVKNVQARLNIISRYIPTKLFYILLLVYHGRHPFILAGTLSTGLLERKDKGNISAFRAFSNPIKIKDDVQHRLQLVHGRLLNPNVVSNCSSILLSTSDIKFFSDFGLQQSSTSPLERRC